MRTIEINSGESIKEINVPGVNNLSIDIVDTGKKTFEVRGLKRKEIKALKKDGIVLTNLDMKTADTAMDKVFDLVFTSEQVAMIDELPNRDAIKLWQGILMETFGAPGEKKNS